MHRFSRIPSFGILGTHPPTPCGIATFSAALSDGLEAKGASVTVVRVADEFPSARINVIGELVNGSPNSVAACSELLNQNDIAVIQHEYGIYGGLDGEEIVQIMAGLRVPSIVIAHTVLKDPTPHQRSVLEAVAESADQLVVMSEAARFRLGLSYAIDRNKVVTIPHGATVPHTATQRRPRRPIILTWGLLGPGKGIERVIDAMVSLKDLPGQPRYLIAGRTHPKVLAAEGEAYRESLIEQARCLGIAASVSFDPVYRSAADVIALVQSAAVVVLPYDSRDQVTSGVLVDSVASGRPIVATAFPHAIEMLGSGAGTVVPHDDPDAMVSALRRLLTDPRIAGSMAAESRELAPTVAWPIVANTYIALAQRLVGARLALT